MTDTFAHRAAEWDSPEKTRMTEIFVAALLKQIKVQPNWKAMEIGTGTGLAGLQIAGLVNEIVYEDTSEAMLEILKQKIVNNNKHEIVHGEVFDYVRQDIDLIFSCMAFHHITDIDKTLKHLATITTSSATIIVGDLKSEDGSFHRFEPIPHKGFDTEILSEQFRKAGFDVISCNTYNTLTRERVAGIFSDYEQFMLIAKKRN